MMTFNNPRFKPRPIYIRAEVESSNKQAVAEFEHELKDLSESFLICNYSAIINELVDIAITAVIDHFEFNLKSEKLIERYTEELLNNLDATKLYYDGQDLVGRPIFQLVIKFDKKLEKHWNTYTEIIMLPSKNKTRIPTFIKYRKYQKGNNYMTLRFTYETGSNWFRFQLHKTRSVCTPDEDNVKVCFVVWKEDKPEVPFHKVRDVLSYNRIESYQVWNKDLSAKIYLG